MDDFDVPESLLKDAAGLFLMCDQDEHLSTLYGIDIELQVTDALVAFAREEPFSVVVSQIDRCHPSADSAVAGLKALARKHGRDTSLPRTPRIPVPPEIAYSAFAVPLIDLLERFDLCDEVLSGLGAAAHLLNGGDIQGALDMVPNDRPHSETIRHVLIGLPDAEEFLDFIGRSQFVLRRYRELRQVSHELDDVMPLGRLLNTGFWSGYEGIKVEDYLPDTEVWLCFW